MTYTAAKPPIAQPTEELRARIPGWGVDLDPHDRPSVPREKYDPGATGAHWEFPDRQPERWPRERSVEHGMLPPVFGTACPPTGVSGAMRRHAYKRYSEGRAAHWLVLMAADRVDTFEHTVRSFATGHPDNLITETGVLAEIKRHGIKSRLGRRRTDLVHQAIDPFIIAAPWAAAAGAAYLGARALTKAVHPNGSRS